MATTTRFVGTCPVCEGRIKVGSGNLVHHGYQRPGYGHILGDCFAVGCLPHETSPDTAKQYLAEVILPRLTTQIATKARVETAKVLSYTYERRVGRDQKVPVMVQVKQGDVFTYHSDEVTKDCHSIPSFDDVRRVQLANLEREIRALESENERLTKLIDTWTKQDLTTVEEETRRNDAAAQAKRDEKKAAREAKKAEKAQRGAA